MFAETIVKFTFILGLLIIILYLITSIDFVKKNKKQIILYLVVFILFLFAFIGIPIILNLFLKISKQTIFNLNGTRFFGNAAKDSNDWLGFWGGYLGAIVAIAGVFWQVTRTNKSEKESQFRIARPFFIARILRGSVDIGESKNRYYTALDYERDATGSKLSDYLVDHVNQNMVLVEINNVSSKSLMAVVVELIYEDEVQKNMIDKISANSTIHIVDRKTVLNWSKSRRDINYWEHLLKGVKIQFTTELREKIQLVFTSDESGLLKYDVNSKILENKCSRRDREKINREYTVNKFYTTQQFIANEDTIRRIYSDHKLMDTYKDGRLGDM